MPGKNDEKIVFAYDIAEADRSFQKLKYGGKYGNFYKSSNLKIQW